MKKKKVIIHHNIYIYTIIPLLAIAAIVYVDRTSIISYAYTLFIFFVFHHFFLDEKERDRNFCYFHYYLVFALVLTCIFRYQIPEYLGMTGPEGGIGTDDCRFYAQIVAGKDIMYPVHISLIRMHHFSTLIIKTFPFEVETPLNIVIFNLLGVCFLPYYMKKLTYELFKDEKLASKAAFLSLLCPFTTYYGSILMRDMFVTELVVAGMYYYLRRNYVGLGIAALILLYIRFGSFAYLMTGVLLIMRRDMILANKSTVRFTFLMILLIVTFYISYEIVQEMSGGKLGESILRSTNKRYFQHTTISRIATLPIPLNIILGTAFFFVCPIFGISFNTIDNVFVMSRYFHSTFNGLFFFFLWPLIFNAIMSFLNRKNPNLQLIVLITLSFCALLGTIDLQIRHKTVVYPFFCLLGAYGMVRYDKKVKLSSFILGSSMILLQLMIFIVSL